MTAAARTPGLDAEDEALLDRLAARVVELRMEVPAILALESGRPLTFLASQAMIFFEPFARTMFRLPDYRRYAALVERREAIEWLVTKIEARADQARRARRDDAAERRAARRPPQPH